MIFKRKFRKLLEINYIYKLNDFFWKITDKIISSWDILKEGHEYFFPLILMTIEKRLLDIDQKMTIITKYVKVKKTFRGVNIE